MTNFAMEPLVRNAWYIAGWSHEIDEGILARRIMNENVVLFRTQNGDAGALEDRCCHRGVKLSLGYACADGITCGYHGLAFGTDGSCIDNPGEDPNPSFKVKHYPLVEKNKFLWIWMGDPALADESLIIEFPYHDDPSYGFQYGHYPINANYMFMIDNLMDLTHLGYVHGSTIGGDTEKHNVAELETFQTENGARFVRWMGDVTPPPTFVSAGGFEGNIDRLAEFEYKAPASVTQIATVDDAGQGDKTNPNKEGKLGFRLFHHATPVSECEFIYFFSAGVHGVSVDSEPSKKFFEDILEAFLEDKLFIEAQQDAVAEQPDRQLLLRQHDKAVAFARQAIKRLQVQETSLAAE